LANANIELTGSKAFEIWCRYGGVINYFHQIDCKVNGCDIDPRVIKNNLGLQPVHLFYFSKKTLQS